MSEKRPEDDDRRVIIIERDSGIGWAVAFIVIAIAIGFGVIVFMDQQSMIEYKIEKALQEMQAKERLSKPLTTANPNDTSPNTLTTSPSLDSDSPGDVKDPANTDTPSAASPSSQSDSSVSNNSGSESDFPVHAAVTKTEQTTQ